MNKMYQDLINDLVSVLHHDAYLSITIDNRLRCENYSDQDAKIYTKIMYGVVEKKLLIDYYLSPLIKGIRVKPYPKCALRMGAYVLDEMNLKDYFIVNEIVSIVKKTDYKSAMFINAVLRNYQKTPKPDLNKLDLIKRKSLELSIPEDLLNLLYKQYGAKVFDFYQNPNKINNYRINNLKTTDEEVEEFLNQNNIEFQRKNNSIKTAVSLINTPLFKQGLIIAQDESSMKVAEVVSPLKGESILDVCSAPGGKSLYMACLMENEGYIMSCDVSEEKISKIKDNADRLGVSIIDTRVLDGTSSDYGRLFDQVLVDAPCSGLGTINHKPDLKYRLSLNDLKDIENLQFQIINNACKYVKTEGFLTYSTCTINQNENEKQIQKFIKVHPEFKIIEEHVILPSVECDGFYICKMKKEVKND